MNMRKKLAQDPRAALFEAIDDQRTGMLVVRGTDQHLQPMTHFADAEKAELWFISSNRTDLVRAVGQGAEARYCVMTPDGEFYASIAGELEQSGDAGKLDEIWSAVASAWFPGGRDDPDVSLLKFTPREAAMWATTPSSVIFGMEIARANMQAEHKPDIGDHVVIEF